MSWILGALSAICGGYAIRQRIVSSRAQKQLGLLTMRRESMRRVLEHLDEGALLLGSSGEVLYSNAAALHLLGAEPRREGELITLDRLTGSAAILEAVAAHRGGTERRVVMAEAEDQESFALELTVAPAGPERLLLVLRDVRESAAVERKRRDFVANASHELKTPIAALFGILDLIDIVSEEKRQELMERARRNAFSLAEMTEDLLGIARAEDPDWRPLPVTISLAEAVEEVVASAEQIAEGKGLVLSVEIADRPLELEVDPTSFKTVLRNLVQNAINYTPEGSVQVRLTHDIGIGARVEVEDTGPGIDPEVLPHIFERFFRGDPAHSRATGGTGLGLSIARNLVNRMGGRIAVESRCGEGTLFWVELPEKPSNPLPGSVAVGGR
ncbi:MAG: HAMP domain-containing histidine kinase [Planctomycetes bacterium]|nr:HAMP domain-containing histidine kinase [Planctomycetota bacterium]